MCSHYRAADRWRSIVVSTQSPLPTKGDFWSALLLDISRLSNEPVVAHNALASDPLTDTFLESVVACKFLSWENTAVSTL